MMNKRILELAKEADILEWEVLSWNKDAKTPNHESAAKVAKFAELIIQECAETVQDFVDHRFPASEYPSRLKRYFGVE